MRMKLVSAIFLTAALNAAPASAGPGDNTLGVAVMSAVVEANGTLTTGGGAVSVTHNQAGIYGVKFVRDVTGCTAVGSPRLNAIAIGTNATNTDTVTVFTTSTGNQAFIDAAFNLIVFCTE